MNFDATCMRLALSGWYLFFVVPLSCAGALGIFGQIVDSSLEPVYLSEHAIRIGCSFVLIAAAGYCVAFGHYQRAPTPKLTLRRIDLVSYLLAVAGLSSQVFSVIYLGTDYKNLRVRSAAAAAFTIETANLKSQVLTVCENSIFSFQMLRECSLIMTRISNSIEEAPKYEPGQSPEEPSIEEAIQPLTQPALTTILYSLTIAETNLKKAFNTAHYAAVDGPPLLLDDGQMLFTHLSAYIVLFGFGMGVARRLCDLLLETRDQGRSSEV